MNPEIVIPALGNNDRNNSSVGGLCLVIFRK